MTQFACDQRFLVYRIFTIVVLLAASSLAYAETVSFIGPIQPDSSFGPPLGEPASLCSVAVPLQANASHTTVSQTDQEVELNNALQELQRATDDLSAAHAAFLALDETADTYDGALVGQPDTTYTVLDFGDTDEDTDDECTDASLKTLSALEAALEMWDHFIEAFDSYDDAEFLVIGDATVLSEACSCGITQSTTAYNGTLRAVASEAKDILKALFTELVPAALGAAKAGKNLFTAEHLAKLTEAIKKIDLLTKGEFAKRLANIEASVAQLKALAAASPHCKELAEAAAKGIKEAAELTKALTNLERATTSLKLALSALEKAAKTPICATELDAAGQSLLQFQRALKEYKAASSEANVLSGLVKPPAVAK